MNRSDIRVSTWQASRATRAEGHAKELLVSESKARALAQPNEKKASQLAFSERAVKGEQAKQRKIAEDANERAMQALGSFTDELMQNLFASKQHVGETEKAVLRRVSCGIIEVVSWFTLSIATMQPLRAMAFRPKLPRVIRAPRPNGAATHLSELVARPWR